MTGMGHFVLTFRAHIGETYEGTKCPRCHHGFMGAQTPRLYCPICLNPSHYGGKVSHFYDDVQPLDDTESVTDGCVICGGEIKSTRPDVKTCSPKCRKSLSRSNGKGKKKK